MSAPIAEQAASFHVELQKGDSWVRLSLYLGEAYTGGQVVQLAPGVKFLIEVADELASSYGRKNWLSGIASGVFFAFRTLGVPRQVVYVSEFAGHLHSADMPAVAAAAARAVAGCLHRDAPGPDIEGWQAQSPAGANGDQSIQPTK